MATGYKIEDILKEGTFGTFPSAEDCISYMVEEGYLEGDFPVNDKVEITAEEISKKYIVAELKDILRENGLKVSGKKDELIERLGENLTDEELKKYCRRLRIQAS